GYRGQLILVRTIALALCLGVLTTTGAAVASEHLGRSTYGQALQWYFDAAQSGDAQAQFLLGRKYETGTDVVRDFAEAATWYEKAARRGHIEAQFKFASLLEQGRGVPADPIGAAQWYERAAQQGYAPAQYNLAVLMLNAASTDAQRIDGLVWLLKARDQGIEAAANFMSRIEALWPAGLMAAAEQRAAGAGAPDLDRAR
ncbi:MAG: tetratricopeptide repeat protein, partial [Alphaproteobacteria bacterium]|nr:tetratricopeptide repeat protein [Alphaproteobacteria bacterium]